MGGIAGMYLYEGKVNQDSLARMGQTLNHRGPEKFSVKVIDRVGLAHNQRRIVDVTKSGDQPYFDESGALIFNGEIYNHLNLRKALSASGCFFRGSSDGETLFQSLKVFGVEKTLEKIRGMFAFAYYDQTNRRLYLCRDRFAIKPLYYTCTNKGLFWASELKALRVEPGIMVDPVRALFSVAGRGDQSAKYTVFKDVFGVPPGCFLVIDESNKKPEIKEYYSILDDIDENYHNELLSQPEDTLLERFEQLLSSSVEKMLMSAAPVGVFVSGGVDSSIVAALACRYQPHTHFFTSNIVGKYSELPFSQLLSEKLESPLHVYDFRPEQLIEDLAASTYYYEAPIIKFLNGIPFSQVANLANQTMVKSALTGEGSDELFLGYPFLSAPRYMRILDYPKTILDRFYQIIPSIKTYLNKNRNVDINHFIAQLSSGFEERYLRARGGLEAFSFIKDSHQRMEYYYSVRMVREILVALMQRNDRMGMRYGVETRFPFLDEDVVRFGLNLPLKWKFKRTGRIFDPEHPFLMDKAIVRLTAKKLLPEKLANKPKWWMGIYGRENMLINPEYFKNGYVAEQFNLEDSVLEYIVETQDRDMVGRLVSLEVFGSIYDRNESIQSVTERNLKYIKMESN